MNGWIDSLYFFIAGAALLLSVLGLWLTAIMPGVDRWSKRFFLAYFIVLMVGCLSGLAEIVLYYYPAPSAALHSALFLESLLTSLPLPMLTAYLLHCCGEAI